MSVVNPADIQALGFSTEAFGTPADFPAYLQTVLDEQEALLTIRTGAAIVADPALITLVSLAEKSLVAAELCQRRINRLIENINPDTPAMIGKIRQQQDSYREAAENIITRLISAPGASDTESYSGGIVATSHFSSDSEGCV